MFFDSKAAGYCFLEWDYVTTSTMQSYLCNRDIYKVNKSQNIKFMITNCIRTAYLKAHKYYINLKILNL